MLWSLDAGDVAFLRDTLADFHTTAYVSGSLAAGLGHANSDLDVHILDRAGAAPALSRLIAPSGRSVQFTTMSMDDLALCERVGAPLTVSPTQKQLFFLSPVELWILYRVSVAVPLVAEPDHSWLFDHHFIRSVATVLIATNAHQAGRAADDAFGMRESGEHLASLDVARSALRHASEMFLASIGDLYASPKFLVPRLFRQRDDWPAVGTILDGLLGTDMPMEAILEAAQELSCWSQLHGWHERAVTTAGPALSRSAGKAPDYTRDLHTWPLRYSTTWSLVRAGGSGFAAGNQLAALWCAVGSGDAESIRRSLAAALGIDATPSKIDAGLSRLLELDLLSERRGGEGNGGQGVGHLGGRDERLGPDVSLRTPGQ